MFLNLYKGGMKTEEKGGYEARQRAMVKGDAAKTQQQAQPPKQREAYLPFEALHNGNWDLHWGADQWWLEESWQRAMLIYQGLEFSRKH